MQSWINHSRKTVLSEGGKAYPDHSEKGNGGTKSNLSWRYTTGVFREGQNLDKDI